METIEPLDANLCLPGHGRPFRDVHEHIEANPGARWGGSASSGVRAALQNGTPKTPFEIVPAA